MRREKGCLLIGLIAIVGFTSGAALAGGHGGGGGGGGHGGGGGGGGFHGGGGGGSFHGGGGSSYGGGHSGGGSSYGGFHGGGGSSYGGFHGGGSSYGGFRPAPSYSRPSGGFNYQRPATSYPSAGFNRAPMYQRPAMGANPGFNRAPSYQRPMGANPGFNRGMGAAPGRPINPYAAGSGVRPASPQGFRTEMRGNTRVDHYSGGARNVYRGGVHQYTQHNVVMNNRPAVQRTYYRGGASYQHNYYPHVWGGRNYFAYAPGFRYGPGFYHYYFTPWARPYPYRWAWYGTPWYSSYGYYFQPYPTYYGPSYWLTDWIIADMLAAQYADAAALDSARAAQYAADANAQAQYDANAQAQAQYGANAQAQAQAQYGAGAPINDAVKDQIRQEVDDAVKAHEAQRPIEIASKLQDTRHIFAVSEDVGVTTVGANAACSLTTGDLIRVGTPPKEGDQAAQMVVVSSKKGSCAVGSVVLVSITDLQSFLNDFTERLEQGLEKMQTEFPQSQPSPQP